MNFNVLDAAKLLDDKILNDKEIKFLVETRHGLVYEEVKDSKEFKVLDEHGFVQRLPLSHPRTNLSIPAVVPTEPGVTLLNEIDKRYRENGPETVAPYEETPENVKPGKQGLREPTEIEKPKILAETGNKTPTKKK